MKLSLFIILFFILSCSSSQERIQKWTFTKDCSTPESVYFDKESGFTFVSNIVGEGAAKDGKGHISKLSKNGSVLKSKWIKGLNAPKGMRSFKGQLWVTDIDRVVVVDIKKSKVIKKFKIKGAKFLNDLAVTKDGTVFISDTLTSKIHKISKGKVSTFLKGSHLESPNGLLVKGDNLVVAAWGLTTDWSTKVLGRLYTVDMKTKKISYITKAPLGNLDGLEISAEGDFLVSDWVKGKVFKISETGKVSLILQGKKGLADIGYIPSSDTILIPYMLNNTVIGI
jgi:hypothetical protein